MAERVDFLAGGNLMSLNLKERKAAVREVSKRYKKASKKEKGKILDEFVKLTDYTRCYGSYILRNLGKKIKININETTARCFTGLKVIFTIVNL